MYSRRRRRRLLLNTRHHSSAVDVSETWSQSEVKKGVLNPTIIRHFGIAELMVNHVPLILLT